MVITRKNIENMEIYDYMKELNERIWGYLFEDSLAHESILQSLNELEQVIISRLLFIQQVVSERAMRLWINPSSLKKLSECIKNLVEAKILVESETKKDNYNQYKINDKFRLTMLNKIYKNNENKIYIFNNNIKEQTEKEKKLYEKNLYPTKEEISNYAHTKWNNLLHFIASPKFNYMNNYNVYNNTNSMEKKHAHYSQHTNLSNYSNDDMNRSTNLDTYSYYNNSTKMKSKQNYTDDEVYIPSEYDLHNETYYKTGKYKDKQYGTHYYAMGKQEDDYDEERTPDDYNKSNNEYYNMEGKEQNTREECNNSESEEMKYSHYNHYHEQKGYNYHEDSLSGMKIGNTNNPNNQALSNQYDFLSMGKKRKRKKQKGVYASKQNDLYYKGLQYMENRYMEEENNENPFFLSNGKKDIFSPYTACTSLIEVLKRKNFILEDDVNSNKVINMSREAFSWFLKDIRSRIISLVIEYLLIIDDGYVTNIAQEFYAKYKKKKKNNNNVDTGNGSIRNATISTLESNQINEKSYINNVSSCTIYGNDNNNGSDRIYNDHMNSSYKEKGENGSGSGLGSNSCYVTEEKKDSNKSEIYVKETLLLILSIGQCNINHPIYLDNLTTAQKEFVNFGIHIGLFFKRNEGYIFVTPYALLLTINNMNVQNYMTILNNLSVEGLSENVYNVYNNTFNQHNIYNQNDVYNQHDDNRGPSSSIEIDKNGHNEEMKKLSEKYFHHYSLLQEEKIQEKEKKIITRNDSHNDVNKNKISYELTNQNLYSDKKLNGYNNLEIGLIVQSNFKVYLYTNSILKINILSHLCELQARTPNMVVGILTRRSVLNAYNSDITANQIIKFLESYGHPGRNNFKSTIPINVITQLRLWESERHRLTLEDAILFKSFEKEFLPQLYQQIVVWANSKNYLLHYTPWPKNSNSPEFDTWMKSEKYLCCTYESKNEIIDKIKEIREKLMKKRQNV
ncbi:hypothetical protein, conserved [Plasmodium gonderi]|uniref:General transcription factor IIH subunit 4 n=1 Tax=Plasmodium gonderi TaxID=77519 RepID=A0A1Y1JMJ6_PLAGO|nr:hypothetical protein, conserved [Plasmodium gonderi]GAW83806.1 hypothetical protein, conserved [Plasmodium gonderi]